MKKYIISLVLFGALLMPILSFAEDDIDPNPSTSTCVKLQSVNLRYKAKDINTNGEVSTLQDFLQFKGYLNTEPTGYFGLLTLKAVKNFQSDSGINPTGYVGTVTKGKIRDLTCDGTITTGGNPVISGITGPQTLNVNQQGTWKVMASDSGRGSLTYKVVWGDENSSPSSYTATIQTATFSHTYNKAGTYNPKFTVTNSSGKSVSSSLSVNVGNVSASPSIKVLSPNGGETYNVGDYVNINWKTYDVSNNIAVGIKVNYVVGGVNKQYTLMSAGDNTGSYVWNIGSTFQNSSNLKVCVFSATSGLNISDCSDNYFTISPSGNSSDLNISSIVGPQTLKVGQRGEWTVKASVSNNAKLTFSAVWGDEGPGMSMQSGVANTQTTNSAIFGHGYSVAGTYNVKFIVWSENTIRCFTTPCPSNASMITKNLIIKVENIDNSPSVSVFSPNGGEVYKTGQGMLVTWNSSNLSSSKVSLLLDYYENLSSPAHLEYVIAENINNSGSYYWTIPSSLPIQGEGGISYIPLGSGFKITVLAENDSNPKTYDSSDSFFTINSSVVTPTVTVSANPSTITQGYSSTITWSANNNPSSCSMTGVSAYGLGASGNKVVSPSTTTTYTVTCTGQNGTISGSTKVTVVAPVVIVKANPSSISSGNSSTISWYTTNGSTMCSVDGSAGYGATGNKIVYPTETKSYEVICTGGTGGTVAGKTTVIVQPISDQ